MCVINPREKREKTKKEETKHHQPQPVSYNKRNKMRHRFIGSNHSKKQQILQYKTHNSDRPNHTESIREIPNKIRYSVQVPTRTSFGHIRRAGEERKGQAGAEGMERRKSVHAQLKNRSQDQRKLFQGVIFRYLRQNSCSSAFFSIQEYLKSCFYSASSSSLATTSSPSPSAIGSSLLDFFGSAEDSAGAAATTFSSSAASAPSTASSSLTVSGVAWNPTPPQNKTNNRVEVCQFGVL